MSDDFIVKKRTDDEVRAIARRIRDRESSDASCFLDIRKLIKKGTIETEYGRKILRYEVLSDSEMGDADGVTESIGDTVRIRVRKTVDFNASLGDGRARMTLAHEYAHGVLHPGEAKFRKVGAVGVADSQIPPAISAEHQAKVFAAALLIDIDKASALKSAEDISIEFGVSLTAAQICWQQIIEINARRASAERILRKAEEFRNEVSHQHSNRTQYLSSPCPSCGNHKLIPIASKFLCTECERVGDLLQDGDRG